MNDSRLVKLQQLGRQLAQLRHDIAGSEQRVNEMRKELADLEKTRDSLMRELGLIA